MIQMLRLTGIKIINSLVFKNDMTNLEQSLNKTFNCKEKVKRAKQLLKAEADF